jgi:chromosomal replication initiator protein
MSATHYKELWIQIIKHLGLTHDSKKIFSFLNKCTITSIDEDKKCVIVWVANDFVLMQVRKFFLEGLREAVKECYNQQYDVEIIVDNQIVGIELKGVFDDETRSKKQEARADWMQNSVSANRDTKVEKVFQTHKKVLSEYFGVLFDTKYQFDNFVVWPNNEFAYVILQAICQQPGQVHNPFFLHGNVGLGKTHLLQATGNQIISSFPDKTVVYLPTSKLVTEIIESIKTNAVNKFLRKFDEVDVLILDDIQIIANKNACQDILLWLFNDFVDKKKQVIFSGDKPPRQLVQIEDRLKTRFALGTLCEISQPDFETRMAILSQKWNAKGEYLLDEWMELIAQTIVDNVRELEGVTNTLITKKQLLGRELHYEDVAQILRSMGYEYRWQITDNREQVKRKKSKDDEFNLLVERVADYYGLSKDEVMGDSRKKEIVLARGMCMAIAKKQFGWTLEKIGWLFDKNHSSVIYSLEKFEDNLNVDASLKDDWRALGM